MKNSIVVIKYSVLNSQTKVIFQHQNDFNECLTTTSMIDLAEIVPREYFNEKKSETKQ